VSGIAVRPFEDRALPFLARVAPRLDHGPTVSPRDPERMREVFAAIGRRERAMPGEELFVAVGEAGEPLGAIALAPDADWFTGHPRAYVNLLAVDAAAEGRGVGRALMEHAERWARERGCLEVCLDVFAGNAGATAFYERLGYRPDHVRMAKPLS